MARRAPARPRRQTAPRKAPARRKKPARRRKARAPSLLARFVRRVKQLVLLVLVVGTVGALASYSFIAQAVDERMSGRRHDEPARLLDRNGEVLSSLFGPDDSQREVVPLDEMPESLRDAVLAIEDHRFFHHAGFSLPGILRAVLVNYRGGGALQGGSTITQQLVKNFFLTPRKTIVRKLTEIAYAVVLEQRHSKESILEAYLNEVYFGQREGRAIAGASQAAAAIFGRPLDDLSLAQNALLAGLIQAPNRYAPWRNPDEALARREVVLQRMHQLELIDDGALQSALSESLAALPELPERRAGYATRAVLGELSGRYTTSSLEAEGLILQLTLDAPLQALAERAVRQELAALEAAHPELTSGEQPVQAALVAIEPATGSIRALVGGRDFSNSPFDRVRTARRQPGSAFKPIVLAAAMEARPRLLPSSLVADVPLRRGNWNPSNFDGRSMGPMTLRRATERSRNLPFAHMIVDLGPQRVVDMAHEMGIASELAAYPALALGAQEVTPLELCTTYATLANGGEHRPPRLLRAVLDRHGEVLEEHEPEEGERVLGERTAWLIGDMLRSVVSHGTGRSAAGRLPGVAGKSGTTNNARDAWFAGFYSELAVVVWVGFDVGRPLGLTGSQAALPIFARFVEEAMELAPDRPRMRPSDLRRFEVCAESGERARPACPDRRFELRARGEPDGPLCPEHGLGALARGLRRGSDGADDTPGSEQPIPPGADTPDPGSDIGPPSPPRGFAPDPAQSSD